MNFTIFTLLTASMQVTIFTFFLIWWLKRRIISVNCLSGILFVITILPFVRLLLPIEFSFTHVIRSTKIYPYIFNILKKELFLIASYVVTPVRLFIAIWLLGSLIVFISKIQTHLKFISCFHAIPSAKKQYCDLVGYTGQSYDIKQASCIAEPMIYGLLRPTILLPTNQLLTDKDLMFVIKHELGHLYHHDLYLKWLLEILCSIYWWIPPINSIKKYAYFIMEIRADHYAIGDDINLRGEYLDSLLKIFVNRQQDYDNPNPLSTPFCYFGTASTLSLRFEKMSNNPKQNREIHKNSIGIVLVSVQMLIVSFVIVIQPDYGESSMLENRFVMTSEYYLEAYNNGYYLCLDGQRLGFINEVSDEMIDLPIIEYGGYEND